MAFSTASNGGGRRPGRNIPAIAEINVTPFVDVVLVLLIIFMLTAHVVEYGIDINVPKTQTTQGDTKDLPIVEISKTGTVYFGKDPANIHQLVDLIHKKYGENPAAVYLRADRETPFDPIVQVMSILSAAKLPVSIVTQPLEKMPAADILDQHDPIGKPFAGSLLFHGGLLAAIVAGPMLLPAPVRLGDPNPHGGTIGVSVVSTIPLPRNQAPENKLANDTKSLVPQEAEPKPVPKPVVKEKLPDPDSIRIPTRDKKRTKRIERERPTTVFKADKLPEPNQVFSHTEQAASSKMYGIQGNNGIGVGPSNPFGEQFGWYAQKIFDRVGQKWNRADVTSRPKARATVRFLLLRDGSVDKVQLLQQSGSYTLDSSAQRAVYDAVPLPPFPAGFPYKSVSVDLNFELQP